MKCPCPNCSSKPPPSLFHSMQISFLLPSIFFWAVVSLYNITTFQMFWASRSDLATTSILQSFLIRRSSEIPTCFLLFGHFQLLLQIPQVSDVHARQHGTKTKKNRGMYRMLHCFCRFCWRISLNSWFIMCFECVCANIRDFNCE